METTKLVDRVVVEFKGPQGHTLANEFIANKLREIADAIEDGRSGDDFTEDIGAEFEVLWEHESVSYGGFRMVSDKPLICQYYYGSEPKPRIIKDDEFVVCYLTKSDIEQQHFDPSGIDDDTMESIASRMNEYLCEGVGYWDALDAACEFYDIPRKEE